MDDHPQQVRDDIQRYGWHFDTIQHRDGSHTEVLWATPIYQSERMFVKQHGWKALIELFLEHETEPADLWRPPVV